MKILPLLRMMWPVSSMMAGALAWVVAWKGGMHGAAEGAAFFAVNAMLCMFAFLVNDLSDLTKDRVAGRVDKPLVTGAVKVRWVQAITVGLVAGVLGLSGMFEGLVEWSVVALMLLAGYAYFARWLPMLKGLYTAMLVCTPVILAAVVTGWQPWHVYLVGLMVVFIWGQEILLDICDLEYDRKAGLKTLPALVGERKAFRLGTALMLGAMVAGFWLVNDRVGDLVLAVAIGLLGSIMLTLWPREPRKSMYLSQIARGLLLLVVLGM